jgi:hypothetical protein
MIGATKLEVSGAVPGGGGRSGTVDADAGTDVVEISEVDAVAAGGASLLPVTIEADAALLVAFTAAGFATGPVAAALVPSVDAGPPGGLVAGNGPNGPGEPRNGLGLTTGFKNALENPDPDEFAACSKTDGSEPNCSDGAVRLVFRPDSGALREFEDEDKAEERGCNGGDSEADAD